MISAYILTEIQIYISGKSFRFGENKGPRKHYLLYVPDILSFYLTAMY